MHDTPAHNRPMSLTPAEAAAPGILQERQVRRVVHAFYELARDDDLLGPVFEARVADWDAHLDRMCDFWSAAIHRTGRYAGRPMEAHRDLPGLTAAHFERWLELWRRTVRGVLPPEAGAPYVTMAERMGASMIDRLGLA